MTINLWVFPPPAGPYFEGGGAIAFLPRFDNITITFTKPDGSKDTFAPIEGSNIGLAAGQTETGGTIGSIIYQTKLAIGVHSLAFPGETFNDYPPQTPPVTSHLQRAKS